jgi:hypothetical protein
MFTDAPFAMLLTFINMFPCFPYYYSVLSLQGRISSNQEKEKNYISEIFDDDDFYHTLLRELIQRKATDLNDPMAIAKSVSSYVFLI